MISRDNFSVLNSYFAWRANNLSDNSIALYQSYMVSFLTFLGNEDFKRSIFSKGPNYKNFLLYQKRDAPYSAAYLRKQFSAIRAYLTWYRDERGLIKLTDSWIRSNFSLTRKEENLFTADAFENEQKKFFTLAEIGQIAQTPTSRLVDERIKAGAAFLFLSAMRISAFLTLPIAAFNPSNRYIYQTSDFHVKTKNSKNSTTKLINGIEYPELLQTVYAWDAKIRGNFPPETPWFTNIDPKTGKLSADVPYGLCRDSGFREDLNAFLAKIGIPPRGPHAFRHTHIRYGRKKAHNMEENQKICKITNQTLGTMLGYGPMSEAEYLESIDELYDRPLNANSPIVDDDNNVDLDEDIVDDEEWELFLRKAMMRAKKRKQDGTSN